MIKGLGWKPPLPTVDKPQFSQHFAVMPELAPAVDLRAGFPSTNCWDQADLGSCTAHAALGLAWFLMKKLKFPIFMPSRLAEYYWTRAKEGTTQWDAGASVQDAMQTMNDVGVAHESLWWYNTKKFAVKPNMGVVADARKLKVTDIFSVRQTPAEMKTCLAMGFPIDFGFTVYESFDNITSNGVMPMPVRGEQILGGHSVLIVGYDDTKQWFICRNSWSNSWGDKGHFYMPYNFAFNSGYCDDFWTAHSLEVA